MMKMKKALRLESLLLAVLLVFTFTATVFAASASRTGVAVGHYRNPQTDAIEDSGGEENEALGQSMVDNVVDPTALLEQADGKYYMTLRFNLASNLSQIDLFTQEVGESDWTAVETTEKDRGEDSVDLCFPVGSEDTIVRAECFVDAMGRAVIFFVTVSDYTDGNTSGYCDLDLSQTDSAQSASSGTDADLLDGVPGLTVGGNTADNVADVSEQDTGAQTGTVLSSTLVLESGVWVRIFLIAFSGCFLAGLCMELLKLLANKVFNKNKEGQTLDLDDGESENDDIPEGDWDEKE